MIDKMIERLDELKKGVDFVCPEFDEIRDILLSARPEWDAMVKKISALEERAGLCTCPDHKEPHVHHVPPKKPSECEWKCPHCGKDEGTWFDRTISYDSEGNETGMATRCNACGKDIDEKPTQQDDKPSECEPERCEKCFNLLGKCTCLEPKQPETITIPRAVAERYIEWINGEEWAFEDGVENLRNAIKKSLGRP